MRSKTRSSRVFFLLCGLVYVKLDLTPMEDVGLELLPSLAISDSFTTTLVLENYFPLILQLIQLKPYYIDENDL